MMLPDAWVKSLFARMQVRYGDSWTRKWEGLDMAAVEADWSEELGGFANAPDAIKYGLAHLPREWPPTAGQFAALCLRRPDAALPALPAPTADAAVVAAAVAKAIGGPKSDTDPKAWAWRLRRLELECCRLSMAQRAMWREALKVELADKVPA